MIFYFFCKYNSQTEEMKVHFIAIGGSVMHNLAIALHLKGYEVSGSDDQIFDPARSRLEAYRLLPPGEGWNPGRIHNQLDAVILGMHARPENPELKKARDLNLKIWSFPEYLYQQTRNKKRVVVGGSHGKTTITSMIMHVLREAGISFDYMVGAQVAGFDTMVGLSHESETAVFEGDEYLSSPIGPTPKFHLYRPHIAIISGIAWDHINVFPTFDYYLEQFRVFVNRIEPGGTLIYHSDDPHTAHIAGNLREDIKKTAYKKHPRTPGSNHLLTPTGQMIPFHLFGQHNAANVMAALEACRELGIEDQLFYSAIQTFKGASKRLEKLGENNHTAIFLDFAHAPSKLKATVCAVKERFPDRKLVACMELHTFSSLNKNFLDQYAHTLDLADTAMVYYNPDTIRHKKLDMLQPDEVRKAFALESLRVYTDASRLRQDLLNIPYQDTNLLLMTSGNFNHIDLHQLTGKILH